MDGLGPTFFPMGTMLENTLSGLWILEVTDSCGYPQTGGYQPQRK